ncbi:MAG TPA: carboxypeptidase-like regulatory domain-containing protein, partial [Cyclobacteriaceae bacterium]|nr:carboxypeptidase-like regulatory domain-containing protein [Cyclobacteriaceae bacterium]
MEEISKASTYESSHRFYAAIVKVEKVYKGNIREGADIKIFHGGGGDCTGGFYDVKAGDKFLLYMGGKRKMMDIPTPLYSYGVCSRSTRLETATSDLKYLDNRATLVGKTRLSGTIRAFGENMKRPSVSGLKVQVFGKGFYRTLFTDDNGFFEIWGLPPGQYSINYKLPSGWLIDTYRVLPETRSEWLKETTDGVISASVIAKKHTEIISSLTIDNEISGRLVSSDDLPMKNVCIQAFWLNPTSDSYAVPRGCTNDNGEFRIKSLPPGKYRLEINSANRLSAETPFEKFYYPSTRKAAEAEQF